MKLFNRLVATAVLLLGAAAVQAQEVRAYFITDAVGSPVIATDAYGNVTWSEDYLPYGERRYRSTSSGANERWYTSAPQNEDTGLVDLGNRQYDPVIGRFLGIDPVGASPEQPFSVNRYAYGNNNPYRYTDPQGNIPVDTVWDIGSVAYDLGKVAVGWSVGNQTMVVEGLGDAGADTAAMFIPYVPAGSTKIARMGAKAADDVADAGKAVTGKGVGSPTVGKPVDSGTRGRILARDQKPDGSWECATCGQSTRNPANIHTGHVTARSKGGDLSDGNLRCEGAACNLSQGNRDAPKAGMTCMERGSCGAPYGRSD